MLNHLSCSSCISTSSRCYYPPHPLFLPCFNCTTYSTYFTFCLSRVTTPLRLSSLLFVIHIPLCLICYVSPESWFHLKTLRQKSKIKKCTKVPLESWVMASAGIQLNKLSQDLSQMFVQSHSCDTAVSFSIVKKKWQYRCSCLSFPSMIRFSELDDCLETIRGGGAFVWGLYKD